MAESQFKENTKRYPDGFEAVKAIDWRSATVSS
jgi:hypothetical protein